MAMLDAIVDNRDGAADALFEGAHALQTAITWEDVIALHIRMYAEIVAETQPA